MIILIGLAAFTSSCTDGDPATPDSTACFNAEPSSGVAIGEVITFTNCSENAESYAWDFGDGNLSNEESPTHAFTSPGNFTVTLVTTANNSSDTISATITVKGSRKLQYNNTEFSVADAFLVDDGYEDGPHYYTYFGFSDENIDVDESAENWTFTSGSIHFTVELLTPSTSGFKPGTYTYTSTEDNLPSGESFFTDVEFTISSTELESVQPGSTIIVSQLAVNIYSFDFDITFGNGKTLTGTYTGDVRSFDWSN